MGKKENITEVEKDTEVAQEERSETKRIAVNDVTIEPAEVVYVGPSIINVVVENTVFNNGLTHILQEKCKEHPILKSMIVPLSEYAAALAQLRDPRSGLSIMYKKIREEIADGRA